ncbi:GNAT family N-acetyltransferase [Roseovarius sp.]|uniref:GNAT family N-acetyltransferase n=1 Tax=Roseovarius sp. TaxID=1486281 RepID=UPI003A979DE5
MRYPNSDRNLTFSRLAQVPLALLVDHMSDPRVAQHMPLLVQPWDAETAQRFVAAKEAYWQRDGLGHWAILSGGRYIGWGGFQNDGGEWDFGLVLRGDAFGLGLAIAREALDFARADVRIPYVTFLLPPSRRHLGALARIGAQPLGEVLHETARFLKFRLETPCTGTSPTRPSRKEMP